MKILLAGILLTITIGMARGQTIYISHNVKFDLFSTAPIEDIKAESRTGVSALDIASRSVYFKVEIRSFEFEKSLMQEHFNEDYLESNKYPYAEFRGNIKDNIDLYKNGTYPVLIQGNLTLHNVTRSYTVKAELKIQDGKIMASSSFPVKLVDHQIKIPKLVVKNIAEIIQVTVSAEYEATAK